MVPAKKPGHPQEWRLPTKQPEDPMARIRRPIGGVSEIDNMNLAHS